MNPRPAWITPREEPETIEFHREVPLWELGEIAEEITDADYRKESTGSLEVFGMSEWISVRERLPIKSLSR